MSLRAEMQQEVMLLNMEKELESRAGEAYGKSLKDCDNRELYYILLELTKNMASFSSPISSEISKSLFLSCAMY